ncbi:hypothetical protein LCL95_05390 [Bacillus timonensis]|nr:hypothetical protein [Bacillus timonensis]
MCEKIISKGEVLSKVNDLLATINLVEEKVTQNIIRDNQVYNENTRSELSVVLEELEKIEQIMLNMNNHREIISANKKITQNQKYPVKLVLQ